MTNPPKKNYLDTTIARSSLTGIEVYKGYLKGQLADGGKYVNPFIQMELKRSLLMTWISFYFTLNNPYIKTVADAYQFFSNRFKGSELKASLQSIGAVFGGQKIDADDPGDKQKALIALGSAIFRLESRIRRAFTSVGRDASDCSRARVVFDIDFRDLATSFRVFAEKFNDVKRRRNECRIDRVLFERYPQQVKRYVEEASTLPKALMQKASNGLG